MSKRSYKQNCALAHAADLVGDRWTLLIVRELLLGPRSYGALMTNLPGIGTNLLAKRIEELSEEEIVRKLYVPNSKSHRYVLTDKGHGLEPVILSLVRWHLVYGEDSYDKAYHHDPDWDLLALKSLLKPSVAPSEPITIGFKKGAWARYVSVSVAGYKVGIMQAGTKVDALWPGTVGSLKTIDKNAGTTPAAVVAFLECFEPI